MAGAFLFRRLWLRLLWPRCSCTKRTAPPHRGRTFAIRVLYVLALLAVIYLTYPRVKVMTLFPGNRMTGSVSILRVVIRTATSRPPRP